MSKFKTPPKPSLEVQLNGWKIIAGVLAALHVVATFNHYWNGGGV